MRDGEREGEGERGREIRGLSKRDMAGGWTTTYLCVCEMVGPCNKWFKTISAETKEHTEEFLALLQETQHICRLLVYLVLWCG